MKCKPLIVALVGSALAGQVLLAHGTCTSGTIVFPAAVLRSTLSGHTVCATRGSERWQEFHDPSGSLIDYKRGPADPVDKTETVGTWATSIAVFVATVTYNYGSGGTYIYTLRKQTDGTYDFCGSGGNNVFGATVMAGSGACP